MKLSKASRLARQGKKPGDMTTILFEGEKARRNGETLAANPYPIGTEDNELWTEGFEDVG